MTDRIKDGGPAFPQLKNSGLAKADGEGGFVLDKELSGGMALRDYFAGQALAGISSIAGDGFSLSPEDEAAWAYQRADAMLSAREGKQ